MRRRSLKSDTRAAVYVEFLVVFMPVFTLWLGMTQIGMLFAGDVIVQHAADAAARSAIVVLPDDPARYGGPEESPKNTIDWSDSGSSEDSDPSGLAGILGGLRDAVPMTGDARLNTIRRAAYKPLLGISPTPSQIGNLDSSQNVRSAVGGAPTRLVTGIVYNLAAVSVTFPSAPGASGVQVDGIQTFPYTRDAARTERSLTTRVTYMFHCSVPFAAELMCDTPMGLGRQSSEGFHELSGAMVPVIGGGGVLGLLSGLLGSRYRILRRESTLLYQGAEYLYASEQGGSSDHEDPEGSVPDESSCRPRSTCTRVCTSGVACGGSCQRAGGACHTPPGGACNVSDVCP